LLPDQPAGPQKPFTRREGTAESVDPANAQIGLAASPTHAPASPTASPAQAAAQPPATSPAAQQLPDQVVRLLTPLRVAADGDYTMSLQLHPAELGDVAVQVAVRGGVLSVVLQADDAAGHHALQAAMPDLHHQLRGDGMHVGDISLLPVPSPAPVHASAQNGQSSHQFGQSANQGNPLLGQPGQHGQSGHQFGGHPQPGSGRRLTTADLGPAGYSGTPNQSGNRDAGHPLPRHTAETTVLDVEI
jgi:flagellar hook-length control protein FliK